MVNFQLALIVRQTLIALFLQNSDQIEISLIAKTHFAEFFLIIDHSISPSIILVIPDNTVNCLITLLGITRYLIERNTMNDCFVQELDSLLMIEPLLQPDLVPSHILIGLPANLNNSINLIILAVAVRNPKNIIRNIIYFFIYLLI